MTEPAWWAQARKLYAPPYTLTQAAIGRLLHKDQSSVRYAVMEEEYREEQREIRRKRRSWAKSRQKK